MIQEEWSLNCYFTFIFRVTYVAGFSEYWVGEESSTIRDPMFIDVQQPSTRKVGGPISVESMCFKHGTSPLHGLSTTTGLLLFSSSHQVHPSIYILAVKS